ncbi:MAG: hypothetical protein ACOYZ7_06890 [Chloroflexota bacterium]
MSLNSNGVSKPVTPRPEPISNERDDPFCFSHPAEAAFARVLDFYQIRWQYEPTTFPLEWDEQGQVVTAFSPDFYLVEDDLYIELTTMRQKLVTKKNRKLRLLQELYPGIKCKLMYRRDVENMAVKYGLFEDGPMPPLCPDARPEDEDEDDKDDEETGEMEKQP